MYVCRCTAVCDVSMRWHALYAQYIGVRPCVYYVVRCMRASQRPRAVLPLQSDGPSDGAGRATVVGTCVDECVNDPMRKGGGELGGVSAELARALDAPARTDYSLHTTTARRRAPSFQKYCPTSEYASSPLTVGLGSRGPSSSSSWGGSSTGAAGGGATSPCSDDRSEA